MRTPFLRARTMRQLERGDGYSEEAVADSARLAVVVAEVFEKVF